MSLQNSENQPTHIARELRRSTIKEEILILVRAEFRGDFIDAILINSLIRCQSKSRQIQQYIEEERQRYAENGQMLNIHPTKGWFYKKAAELSSECMLDLAETTVRNRLKKYIEKGFILERNNPYHKWDKTKQYRVEIIEIDRIMQGYGLRLDGWLVEQIHVPDPTATDAENDEIHRSVYRSSNDELRGSSNAFPTPNNENRAASAENRSAPNTGAIPSTVLQGSSLTRKKISKKKQQHQSRDAISQPIEPASPLIDVDVFPSISFSDAAASPPLELKPEIPLVSPAPISGGGEFSKWLIGEGIPNDVAERFVEESSFAKASEADLFAALRAAGGRGQGRTSPIRLVAADIEAVRRQLAMWPFCPEYSAPGILNPYAILANRITADDGPPPNFASLVRAKWEAEAAARRAGEAKQRKTSMKARAAEVFAGLSDKQKREFERDLADEIKLRFPGQFYGPGTAEYSVVRLEMLNDPKTALWLTSPEKPRSLGQIDITGDINSDETEMDEAAEDFADVEYSVSDAVTVERAASEMILDLRSGVFPLANLASETRAVYAQFDDNEIAEIVAIVHEKYGLKKAA